MKPVTSAYTQQKNKQFSTSIILYGIRYDATANKWLYYTNYGSAVTYDGIEYVPAVIHHDAFKENTTGKIESVTLEIGNVDKIIQYYIDSYNALRKAKVVIKQVFKEELSDPTCYDEQIYYIDGCSVSTSVASFVLGSSFDIMNVKVPKRTYSRGYCQFRFKGTECGYAGPEGTCNKTIQRCIELGNVERVGMFPAIPMKRL